MRSIGISSFERSFADGESLSGGLFLGESELTLVISSLLDVLSLFSDDEFNVAVGGKVRTDSTVSSEGSSSALDGSVDGDVGDDALLGVETLGLSVGEGVLEKLVHVLDGLLGPSAEGDSVDGSLAGSASVAGVSSEGNALLVLQNVLHVSNGLLDLHTFHNSGSLVSVLEMHSHIIGSALSG